MIHNGGSAGKTRVSPAGGSGTGRSVVVALRQPYWAVVVVSTHHLDRALEIEMAHP